MDLHPDGRTPEVKTLEGPPVEPSAPWTALQAIRTPQFAILCVAAGAADLPLKAMFLGRGVSLPTSVILLGAIGGMVSMGIMGLFIGAVVLGVGYKLAQAWLEPGRMGDAAVESVGT